MQKKSPISQRPLNTAGQSLQRNLTNKMLDGIVLPFMIGGMLVTSSLQAWLHWWTEKPVNPWFITVFSLIGLLICGIQIRKTLKMSDDYKLGVEGEREVGHQLEQLRKHGAQVIHDIDCGDFNIDHIVVHPAGVFVVETKTMRKPLTGRPELVYDSREVKVNERALPRNPVAQVNANERWLQEFMRNSIGHALPTRGVVLFPGWFVKTTAPLTSQHAWVLNPKAFEKYLANEPRRLTDDQVHMCFYHLSRYVVTTSVTTKT